MFALQGAIDESVEGWKLRDQFSTSQMCKFIITELASKLMGPVEYGVARDEESGLERGEIWTELGNKLIGNATVQFYCRVDGFGVTLLWSLYG